MSDTQRIWERMKDRVAVFAEHDVVISVSDARTIVLDICRKERTDCPHTEVLEFLSAEFVHLVRGARHSLTAF